jgi:hypothetical protein
MDDDKGKHLEKEYPELEEWNDHGNHEKVEVPGGLKHNLLVGEDILEVEMYTRGLNYMNGMKLGNNSRITFFEELFHLVGTDDLW